MTALLCHHLLQQLSLCSQDLCQHLVVRGRSQVWPGTRELLPLLLCGALMGACNTHNTNTVASAALHAPA